MKLLYYILKTLAPKAKAFEKTTENPIKAQQGILFELLQRHKRTRFGLEHKFSRIKSIKEYQATIPISDYERLRPYIESMTRGEHPVLTADRPVLFGVTSGTTGKPKFIPVTSHSRSKKADVMALWAYYISRDHPKIFNGRILAIVSPEIEGHTASGIPYGAESGHGYKNLPEAVRGLYTIPYEVLQIKDYDAKYYSILRIGMEYDVTTLATLNPSTVILLCQRVERFIGRIIDDIEKGTLDKSLDMPESIRRKIEKCLKPNPGRANELRGILSEKKEMLPKYFWPNMELIECWKAGTVGLYLKEFSRYFGNVPIRDFGYLSSEARGSIPMSDKDAGGVLAVNANFYEFIPREDIDKPDRKLFLCDELEIGREYFIVITTPGGLYRYNIDDVIRVNDFFNKTPVIEFVQKGLNVTSITGEKLYESQVVEAVNRATDQYEVFIEFFTTSIQWGRTPRYVFLVEFTQNPPLDKKRNLLRSIEEELCRINVEYQTKRKSQRLDHPVLKVVANGDFKRYRTQRVKDGAPDGQFKVPQLTPNLDFQKNFKIQEEIYPD